VEAQTFRATKGIQDSPVRSLQAETMRLKRGLESVVSEALTAGDGSLRLHENLAFAILSANDQANYTLHPEEAGVLAPRACRGKREEFALGRAVARLALQELGFEKPSPVLRGQGGEPLWPEGIVGSITHCYPWSIAVVGKYSNRFTIGIDCESVHRAKGADIGRLICRDRELQWVHNGGGHPGRLVMIFSAKETVYKAFYPLCRQYIDFKEVELSWLPAKSCFQGELLGDFGGRFLGSRSCAIHCRRCNDLVFSFLAHEM
jgi:4'-phosphopantetheinyl transferase EntD